MYLNDKYDIVMTCIMMSKIFQILHYFVYNMITLCDFKFNCMILHATIHRWTLVTIL
jgi:hypothetical protein